MNAESTTNPAAAEECTEKSEDVKVKASSESSAAATTEDLPNNRFELELEFVQALASPAYIHFLATSRTENGDSGVILQDPAFVDFLKYLRDTWTRPEYSRFLSYPHALYFLDLLIETPAALKEWTLPAYRNFCHQQQFLTWQHRHATCYGRGTTVPPEAAAAEPPTTDGATPSEAAASSAPTK